MALEFANTAAPPAEAPETTGNVHVATHGDNIVNIKTGENVNIPATSGQPAAPADGGQNQPPADGGEVTDYREAYAQWGRTKGLDIDPKELPETFNMEDLENKVADYYVDRRVADPMMKQLIQEGVNIQEYYQQLQPIQEVLAKSDRELYVNGKVTELVNEQIKLNQLDGNDADALEKAVQKLMEQEGAKIKDVPDDIIKDLAKPVREAYKAQLEELPNKIKSAMSASQEAQRAKQLEDYKNYHKSYYEDVKAKIDRNEQIVVPFNSQADKVDFLKYLNEQTAYGDITYKDQDGKEQVAQGIPFLHRINNDPQFLTQLVRMAYAIDRGTFTEMKNEIRGNVLQKLGLDPIVTKTTEEGQEGRFANTAKASW